MSTAKTRIIFDRKGVATTKKKAPVIIEVYCNRERKFFRTGVELYKDQWKNGIIVKRNDSIELTDRIKYVKENIDTYINERIKAKEEINLDLLRTWIESHSEGNCASFLVFMQKRMRERPMKPSTFTSHMSIYHRLERWGKIVTFSDLTKQNILLWDEESKRHSKTGKTIKNYHKILRIYTKEAVIFGHIKENPYEGYKVYSDREIKHDFLTREEFEKWRNVSLYDELAIKAKDMFIFCCYTGLAYADLKAFNDSLIEDRNGKKRYSSSRIKTDIGYDITLLKPALNIIDKYNGVPLMDDHVYNRYLKCIALVCGINKKITSHCARVTFASTVMLGNKVPLPIIQRAMGHANILQTQEYAKLVKEDIDSEFDRIDSLLS